MVKGGAIKAGAPKAGAPKAGAPKAGAPMAVPASPKGRPPLPKPLPAPLVKARRQDGLAEPKQGHGEGMQGHDKASGTQGKAMAIANGQRRRWLPGTQNPQPRTRRPGQLQDGKTLMLMRRMLGSHGSRQVPWL